MAFVWLVPDGLILPDAALEPAQADVWRHTLQSAGSRAVGVIPVADGDCQVAAFNVREWTLTLSQGEGRGAGGEDEQADALACQDQPKLSARGCKVGHFCLILSRAITKSPQVQLLLSWQQERHLTSTFPAIACYNTVASLRFVCSLYSSTATERWSDLRQLPNNCWWSSSHCR